MIDTCLAELADYGVRTGLIEETDRTWAVNRLLEALQYTLTNLGRENFNPAALERLRAELRSGQTTNQ